MVNRRNILFLVTLVLGVIADQVTKAWVVANVALYREEIEVIPGFFSIVHAQNPGAALSLLHDFAYRHLVFGAFTVIAVVIILNLFRQLPRSDWFMSGTLGLILSGAIGNAIDRVRQQYVTDFIRIYTDQPSLRDWLVGTFGTNEWPTFNIADIALVVGVILFSLHQILSSGDEQEEEPSEAPATP